MRDASRRDDKATVEFILVMIAIADDQTKVRDMEVMEWRVRSLIVPGSQ